MVPATIPLDAPKSDTYYTLSRAETLAHLPKPAGRVLDVGCGEGGAAKLLREGGATWISGIELLADPAARAAQVYDEVLVGDALEQLPAAGGPFDTILCYDVLEHLYDPLALVRALREMAAPGGRLHVSVPNASHISLLRDLILRGTFGYEPAGHRDATHIRWFTRRDILALVGEGGWQVQAVACSQLHRSRRLHTLTHGRSTEFLAGQWYVLARRDA
ncbi:MAG TPA: class I SAM-dependent methyltransferase [Solirubrobacteraceae bacterium]|jgi:2-polyprenyl-3-methyl-5-hydroxy-6-metoxy-1,4-benzoquinol methylase|nr:class I SAM-dependent methyltransferase [Solirubrobacteraceae bacterium]